MIPKRKNSDHHYRASDDYVRTDNAKQPYKQPSKWHSNSNGDDHNDHNPPHSGGQGAKPKKPKPSLPSGGRAVSITPGESLIKAPTQGSYERST
jgi:hypothetical protein